MRRLSPGFSAEEEQRVERALATARVIVALTSLVAVHVDPTDPEKYRQTAYVVLLCYTAWSAAISAALRWRRANRHFVHLIHIGDVIWPSLLCLYTDGADSPFFTLYLFSLLSAAFRWGLWETAATSIASVGILGFESVMLVKGPAAWRDLEAGDLEVNKFIIRCVYLLLAGLMIGYLAESEKELRAENGLITRMLSRIRVDFGLANSLTTVMTGFSDVFRGDRALMLARDVNSGRIFLWQTHGDATEARAFVREVSLNEVGIYDPTAAADAFFYTTNPRFSGAHYSAIERDGTRVKHETPQGLTIPDGAQSLLSLSFNFGQEWAGRMIVLDPQLGRDVEQELRFAQNIVRQVGPALYSVYLLRRLRTRAGAIERARVARELHDGAIQSLIAVEMQVDVIRRQSVGESARLAAELARVQHLLQQEVINLRELMQQMKPVDMGPQQFLDYLADYVDRFRRDTGIYVRFVTDLQEVTLTPKVCRELTRVVQEGLINVRKHSGARNAMVRFAQENNHWLLMIDDDGRGFDFTGRRNLIELDTIRRGPAIIKERVRSIGGELVIQSTPGEGSRLEIMVPKKGHASHG
ncbi:sensor histidine kinase [Candidatus Korobacter versatilis]|uniref:sensor histidine kinase n=1 Tax=Candidatus Korobacter versatilis TaxID=658062 RepID=UPI0005A4638E|nr:histidine kinase [Candidatus Koribacter versatilis]